MQETEFPEDNLEQEIDTYLRTGFENQVKKTKEESPHWASTLDYFLELGHVKTNIDEYIQRQKRNWLKWFRDELGKPIWEQVAGKIWHKMMQSRFVYKDYVSNSWVWATTYQIQQTYREFLH